jgi:glycosyltransferase involved in cell wall biosynthesis
MSERSGALVADRLPPRNAERHLRMRRAAYLIVNGSGGETLREVVIQAFANALPVIASSESDAAELVEHGRNGLLFDGNSVTSLARAIVWAEAFPEKMRQMGDCGKADYATRFIAHWTWHRLFGERRRSARL